MQNAFSVEDRDGIVWRPSNERKYRFNRKEMKVYIDLGSTLKEVGDSIEVMLLQAFDLGVQEMFKMPPQNWVQLAFIDQYNVVSVGYLNDGTTDATSTWWAYQQFLEDEGIPLASVVTTISFSPYKTQGSAYKFSSRPRQTTEEQNQFELAKTWFMAASPMILDSGVPPETAERILAGSVDTPPQHQLLSASEVAA